MEIIFRVDASFSIGTGHVMRCLTLAEALREKGANCMFICRDHPKHIYSQIQEQSFSLHLLPSNSNLPSDNWLGATQTEDAQETIAIIQQLGIVPDWLIVDHYRIDITWENLLRKYVKKIMVIDDLADRPHDCDVLLDQNYSHDWQRYQHLVPQNCDLLLGPEYAILRPQFRQARQQIDKEGRPPFDPRKVFIFFGGVDPDNYTGQALEILAKLGNFAPEVVIGSQNPHRKTLQQQMQKFPEGHLHIQISNMAEVMMRCSWYLGSGGSITWERMCLGLTGIVIPIAENQLESAMALGDNCYHILMRTFTLDCVNEVYTDYFQLSILNLSHKCFNLFDSRKVENYTEQILIFGQVRDV